MDSLCHPWFTTTNLSYRFPSFETSATALCGTIGKRWYKWIWNDIWVCLQKFCISTDQIAIFMLGKYNVYPLEFWLTLFSVKPKVFGVHVLAMWGLNTNSSVCSWYVHSIPKKLRWTSLFSRNTSYKSSKSPFLVHWFLMIAFVTRKFTQIRIYVFRAQKKTFKKSPVTHRIHVCYI